MVIPTPAVALEEPIISDQPSTLTTPAVSDPHRSTRVRHPPTRYTPHSIAIVPYQPSPRVTASLAQAQVLHTTFWHDPHAFIDDPSSPDAYAFSTDTTVRLLDEPRTFAEAMKSPNSLSWRKPCDKELDSIQ